MAIQVRVEVQQDVCCICLDDMEAGRLLITLHCSRGQSPHVFHRLCLKEWLVSHETCPICRRSVPSLKRNCLMVNCADMKFLLCCLWFCCSIILVLVLSYQHNPGLDEG